MALPSSGELSINDISVEAGHTGGSQASLRSLSSGAGKSTPDHISEFYGWSNATLSASPTTLYFKYQLGACDSSTDTVTVTASSSNSWTATADDSWISVTDGSGTGNGSFTVGCLKTTADRTGSITITSSADDVTITVSQTGTCPE